jgi:transcriptional regulator with XRE-family HTH domain
MKSDAFKDRLLKALNGETPYAFALRCGITESLMRKYLNGKSLPGLVRLVKMAVKANVSLEWLATGKGLMNDDTIKITTDATKDIAKLEGNEKERDRQRRMVLADWKKYKIESGEAVKKSMESYARLYNDGLRPIREACITYVPTISGGTIKNWRKLISARGHLGANYGNRKGTGKIDQQPELKTFIVNLLKASPVLNLQQIIYKLSEEFSGTTINVPSEGRVRKWIDNYKKSNYILNKEIPESDTEINVHNNNSEIQELLSMTRHVLESKTEYADSLSFNIKSFHRSVKLEERLDRIEKSLNIEPESDNNIANNNKRGNAA